VSQSDPTPLAHTPAHPPMAADQPDLPFAA
jgi:hypothetical protein